MRNLSRGSAVRFFTMLVLQLSTITAVAQETAVLQWATIAGGTGVETAGDVTIDAAGNIFTTGNFNGTVDFDPGAGVFNITAPNGGVYISKVDSDGNLVWAKSLQGLLSAGIVNGYAIAVDALGNVYTTGELYGTADFDPGPAVFNMTSAVYDVFISKLDSDGDFVWAKQFTSVEQSKDIAVDGSQNIYITGNFRGTIDFDPGTGVFNMTVPAGNIGTFFCKYDTDGAFVWAKEIHYPASSSSNWPGGDAISLDATGNIYAVGAFRLTSDFDPGPGVFNMTAATGSTSDDVDAYILKLDNNGAFVWAKFFGAQGTEHAYSIQVAGTTGLYIVGDYGSNTVDFDPGPGVFNLIGEKIYLSKFDLNGNFVWAKTFGGYQQMIPSLMLDGAGDLYVTCAFAGSPDFDPGPGVFTLTADIYDNYISKLDSDGDFLWAVAWGGNDFDLPAATVIDGSGNLYTHGAYSKTADFDPSTCVYNLTSHGNSDVYTIKLDQVSAVLAPTISSFAPTTGPIGTTVTITGTNFSTTPSANVVKFFNNKTAVVTASTATSLTVTVPTGTITGKISVTTNCFTATSTNDFTIGVAAIPTITGFTPSSGPVGTAVTLNGTNFSATPANNLVKLNGTTATVTASTTNSITLTVPVGATSGKFTVTVGGNTATSTNNFIVTVPGGNTSNDPPQIADASTTAVINGIATLSLGPLLSDNDDNIDLATLHISSDPISGAPASIGSDFVLTINYEGTLFTGTDRLEIEICDVEGACTKREFTVEVAGDIEVFNAISPNGDGKNEVLYIQSVDVIEETRDNKVTIYNRWGGVVFETTNYNNTTNAFRGLSKSGGELPSGTYFYKIEFTGDRNSLTGFVAIRR